MRKAILLLISLSLLFASCNDTGKNETRTKKQKTIPEYTIGVNLPLTGNGSYFAEEVKKGLKLTFDYINEKSDKLFLNVIYEDNKMNPKDAVTITKKFLEIDGVDLIISGYTPIIQATIGMIDQAGVPMLVTLSSVENIASPYPWAFRDFELESGNMPLLASYVAKGLELKKGSYLVVNDETGEDVVKYFSDAFLSEGGEMLEGEVFEAGEMDLRNKVSKVMDDNPEFVIVVGRGSALINAVRQLREQDPDIVIVSNNMVDNEQVWKALSNNDENIYFPRPFIDLENDRYINASKRFLSEYGTEMSWWNAHGISIANYLARGLKESGGDPELLRDYLATLSAPTIRGVINMNENSDVITPHLVFKRSGGRSVPVNDPGKMKK